MSFKLAPFESLGTVSYSPSIVTMALSLHYFRDKARYWSKIVIFSYPFVFDAPVRGSPSDYCLSVWFEKTRMMGLPDDEKSLTICLPVLTECTNVTDRQADRQTDTA